MPIWRLDAQARDEAILERDAVGAELLSLPQSASPAHFTGCHAGRAAGFPLTLDG